MIERDYLMRMINQLAQVLARVLLHKKAYEHPQARQALDGAYRSLLGVQAGFVRSFSDTQLIDLFGKDAETAGVRLYVLGSLLKEEAEIIRLQEGTDSAGQFLKALSILLSSFHHLGKPVEDRHITLIDECVQATTGLDVPVHVLEKLFAFYEYRERYDKAEDILFDLLAVDRDYRRQGMAFYERLLNVADDQLKAGGLPRNEILEGIEHLKMEASL